MHRNWRQNQMVQADALRGMDKSECNVNCGFYARFIYIIYKRTSARSGTYISNCKPLDNLLSFPICTNRDMSTHTNTVKRFESAWLSIGTYIIYDILMIKSRQLFIQNKKNFADIIYISILLACWNREKDYYLIFDVFLPQKSGEQIFLAHAS